MIIQIKAINTLIFIFFLNFLFLLSLTVSFAAQLPHSGALKNNELTCSDLDSRWKTYNVSIKGANTKISNIVKNACNIALGRDCVYLSGYRSPSYNRKVGGAKHSQHMLRKAVDLSIPASGAKRQNVLNLLICGLGKVNNCQGGMGIYRSGSVHVDVRSGRRNIWSTGYHRANIQQNVRSSVEKQTLYNFEKGKCGETMPISIANDTSETQMYGSPEPLSPYQNNSMPQNQMLPQNRMDGTGGYIPYNRPAYEYEFDIEDGVITNDYQDGVTENRDTQWWQSYTSDEDEENEISVVGSADTQTSIDNNLESQVDNLGAFDDQDISNNSNQNNNNHSDAKNTNQIILDPDINNDMQSLSPQRTVRYESDSKYEYKKPNTEFADYFLPDSLMIDDTVKSRAIDQSIYNNWNTGNLDNSRQNDFTDNILNIKTNNPDATQDKDHNNTFWSKIWNRLRSASSLAAFGATLTVPLPI